MMGKLPCSLRAIHLSDILEFWSHRCPDRIVYTFLNHDRESASVSLGELSTQAASVANYLLDVVSPGSRALLLFPPGLEFVSAFFGCVHAGVIAVPTCYPRPHRPMPRLSHIARNCQAEVILSTRDVLEQMDLSGDPLLAGMTAIAVQDAYPRGGCRREVKPSDIALLQYTSGSTNDPKGVILSHRNLVSNLEAIRCGFGLPFQMNEQEERGVFWLPAFHDMGLIGAILSPLYIGGRSYLMSPQDFLQRPFRWLQAMSRTRATITGAPNFAFDLCVEMTTREQRASLDFSAWRLAFCGSEPIRARTLEQFTRAFSESGFRRDAFYPCYGLAENTLFATGSDGPAPLRVKRVFRDQLWQHRAVICENDHDNEVQPLVCVGKPASGHEILIVNPDTRHVVDDRVVGEIWLHGPSKAMGYWNRPDETAQVFAARLHGDEKEYLRTGDLGFVDLGQLYVTGRRKEVIVLRGRNLYPQDIELTVSSAADELRPDAGAAFTINVDGVEKLCIAHEIDRRFRHQSLAATVARIRRAIKREHEVEPHRIILLRQGGIPRTSSNKIRRRTCAWQYLSQQLRVIHEWRQDERWTARPSPASRRVHSVLDNHSVDQSREDIEMWLIDWLERRADVPRIEIDVDKSFADYGLDSLIAVELTAELSTWLGLELSAVLAWNYPTIDRLASYLATQVARAAAESDQESELNSQPDSAEELERLLAEVEAFSDEELAGFRSVSQHKAADPLIEPDGRPLSKPTNG